MYVCKASFTLGENEEAKAISEMGNVKKLRPAILPYGELSSFVTNYSLTCRELNQHWGKAIAIGRLEQGIAISHRAGAL